MNEAVSQSEYPTLLLQSQKQSLVSDFDRNSTELYSTFAEIRSHGHFGSCAKFSLLGSLDNI